MLLFIIETINYLYNSIGKHYEDSVNVYSCPNPQVVNEDLTHT